MNSLTPGLYRWFFLAYLAILPMAETIALRNLLLFVLLVMLAVWWVRQGRQDIGGTALLKRLPPMLLFWVAFLLLFPLWAREPDVAWSNLKGQWGLSIAAWGVGFGAVLMLGRRGPGLWALACASAFLVGLHLVLTGLAWVGLFGSQVPADMPWSVMWKSMFEVLSPSSGQAWSWQAFPWGFRGFDPMHGNLGYTASQAIVLLLACYSLALAEQKPAWAWKAVLAIAACFFSIVVANSRGAVLYSLLLLPLAVGIYLLRVRKTDDGTVASIFRGRSVHIWGGLLLAIALVLVLVQSFSKDARWRTMLDKAHAGFMVEDPVEFLCEGLSPAAKAKLQARMAGKDPAYVEEVILGLNGDGGRILLMRAGVQLVLQEPVGLDGARHSYKKLMEVKCGHRPVFEFAHAHQAWIDTSLALGWGGVLLFAVLLLALARAGYRGLGSESRRPWGYALVLLSLFWLLRGFTDSVYREHYLQMQGLLLGYLWGRMTLLDDAAG